MSISQLTLDEQMELNKIANLAINGEIIQFTKKGSHHFLQYILQNKGYTVTLYINHHTSENSSTTIRMEKDGSMIVITADETEVFIINKSIEKGK